MARKGDVVLILGKGSEESNVVNGVDVPYPGDIKCAEMAIAKKEETRRKRAESARRRRSLTKRNLPRKV